MLGTGSSSTPGFSHPSRRTPRMPITTIDDSRDISDNHIHTDDIEASGLISSPKESPLRHAMLSFIYILGWYLFSISISVYNKWMFSPEHLDFRFPIFSTAVHQLIQTSLAGAILYSVPEWKPQSPFTNFKDYFKRIGPCATASAGDIGMGNLSLRLVTLSFYTMVKSSSLGFVLLFGVFFKLEKPTARLCAIIIFMSLGVLMMVAGETHFQLFGFLLVMGAAACSGLRWSLTQLLLRAGEHDKEDEASLDSVNSSRQNSLSPSSSTGLLSTTSSSSEHYQPTSPISPPSPKKVHASTHNNPIYTILSLSPMMGSILFIISMILEGPYNIFNAKLWQERGFLGGIGLLIFPGILAFCMTLSEFLLLNRTSVLTLAIAGICKEVVTICVACIFFGDRLTFINGLGLFVTTACIGAYNIHRYNESKQHHKTAKYFEDETE